MLTWRSVDPGARLASRDGAMRAPRIAFLLASSLVAGAAQAQTANKPGAFASADTKLDYLLEIWKGLSVGELRAVWGGESYREPRGSNQAYVYERTSRASAGVSVFGGQVGTSSAPIVCTASFEADEAGTIVEVTRQRGGRACWNLFRGYEPPE